MDHVPVGRCKWYDVKHPDGRTIKCQGTWEVAFVEWMIKHGLSFESHVGRIPYKDDEGNEHGYYPDFFVKDWDCYVDVKGAFFSDLHEKKFEHLQRCNPDLKVKVLRKSDLLSLGVDMNSNFINEIRNLS
jgi:hypothetical protein